MATSREPSPNGPLPHGAANGLTGAPGPRAAPPPQDGPQTGGVPAFPDGYRRAAGWIVLSCPDAGERSSPVRGFDPDGLLEVMGSRSLRAMEAAVRRARSAAGRGALRAAATPRPRRGRAGR